MKYLSDTKLIEEGNTMDILAYIILGLAYVFIVCPMIFDKYYTSYLESVKVGLIISSILLLFTIVFCAVVWAALHVRGLML